MEMKKYRDKFYNCSTDIEPTHVHTFGEITTITNSPKNDPDGICEKVYKVCSNEDGLCDLPNQEFVISEKEHNITTTEETDPVDGTVYSVESCSNGCGYSKRTVISTPSVGPGPGPVPVP